MQAGASDRGLTFAGKWAELIFTHQQEKSLMQEFYAKVNAQVRSSGRDPRACAILPSIEVIAGTSQAAADDRAALLDSRSEEHTSELQSLMRISYAVFCLKKTT